jgi:hypothetical protein
MWTLATLVTATVLIPTLAMIGLFRFGKLKRVEDLKNLAPGRRVGCVARSYGRPNRGIGLFRPVVVWFEIRSGLFCLNYGLLQCVSPA